MEGEVVLPEDLVEKIIARMPFPYIFKARGLSKSWLARFSSVSKLHDKEKKCLAISFQKQVGQWSRNWDTFYLFNFSKTNRCAYNPTSRIWQALPTHQLPCELENIKTLDMEGAVLFLHCWPDLDRPDILRRLQSIRRSSRQLALGQSLEVSFWYVANILTGRSKRLPSLVFTGESFAMCETLLSYTSPDTYSLIAFFMSRDTPGYYCVQIYNSKSGTWTSNQLLGISRQICPLFSPARLHGVLYMLEEFTVGSLIAYDVETGSWKDLLLPITVEWRCLSRNLVVCNSKLMMVLAPDVEPPEALRVLQIDPVLLQVLEVTRGPPASLNVGRFSLRRPVSVGNCIYLGTCGAGGKVVVYNVLEDKWSCSDFPRSSRPRDESWFEAFFQPGLNPFAAEK